MSLSKTFATDSEKEVNGVVVELDSNVDGSTISFIIARSGGANKAYARELERLSKPHRRQFQLETASNELAEKITKEVFINAVLKGWNNVPLSDVTGDETAQGYADFSKQNALMLFENLPEVFETLQKESQGIALFRKTALETEAKN